MKCEAPYFSKEMKVFFPCGKCLACRQNRKINWTARNIFEASCYEHNSFITLTYDEKNLQSPYLIRDDLTKFFKRFRKYQKFRYFACGEYGEIGKRPHFHALFFGVHYAVAQEILNLTWDKGFSSALPFEPGAAAYVSGYVSKKLACELSYYSKLDKNFTPEFQTMSRRPGLGSALIPKLIQVLKLNPLDDVPLFLYFNDKKLFLPKYLRTKLREALFTDSKIDYLKALNLYQMRVRQSQNLNISDYDFGLMNPLELLEIYHFVNDYRAEINKLQNKIYSQRKI